MPARIIELANAVVAAVESAWLAWDAEMADDLPPSPEPNRVSRQYGIDIALSGDSNGAEVLTGRKVYVFPVDYSAELIDRAEVMTPHSVVVLIVERYGADEPGRPSVDWMDSRVEFTQRVVWETLRDVKLTLCDGAFTPIPDALGGIDVVYDLDLFMNKKAFWSYGTFAFQEITGA